MFRPANINFHIPQRIPPFPDSFTSEVVKSVNVNGNNDEVNAETFILDTGIYKVEITTPIKSQVNWVIAGDPIDRVSKLGRMVQYLYVIRPVEVYLHYCNSYIALQSTNNYSHLDLKSSINDSGNIYTGAGEYFVASTKLVQTGVTPSPTPPPALRLPSIASQIVNNTTQTTNWHIKGGYDYNMIPISLTRVYYSSDVIMYTLTVNTTPANATVAFNTSGYVDNKSISVPANTTVTFTVSAPNYNTVTRTVVVDSDKTETIHLTAPILAYTKDTPGEFSYTVPNDYTMIIVEIAGAAGQQCYLQTAGSSAAWVGAVGKGAVLTSTFTQFTRQITGVVGGQPPKTTGQSQYGGTGYQNGNNGQVLTNATNTVIAGGGGASTSVTINNVVLTAGGGSGCGHGKTNFWSVQGGYGGGPNGGPTTTGVPSLAGTIYDGNNATTPGASISNTGGGYVKIWCGYNG